MLYTRGSEGSEHGQCELLGSFALLVQAALGALAFLSLVYKRWRERPQRPVKIWFFDVSKQVVGSVLVHIANLLMSMLSSGKFDDNPHDHSIRSISSMWRRREDEDHYHPNPCSFYLLNLLIDTTAGIAILIYSVRIMTSLCEMLPSNWAFSHGITSGDYGQPPKASNWLKQSVIYFAGLIIMKLVVGLLFALFPWLGRVGDFLLKWTEGNRKIQIAFVMFIFPLIMNAVQYYIIDTFIKKQESKAPQLPDDAERPINRDSDSDEEEVFETDSNVPQVQPSAAVVTGGIDGNPSKHKSSIKTKNFDDSSFVYSSDEDEDGKPSGSENNSLLKSKKKSKTGKKGSKPQAQGVEEYNPEVDGETSTIAGSASNSKR